MTVDECAKSLSGHFLKLTTIALGEETDTTAEEVSASIIDSLHALLRTENERCVTICLIERNNSTCFGTVEGAWRAACDSCHDKIRATSPGGGG